VHSLSENTKRVRLPLDTTTTYVGAAGQTNLLTEGIDTLGFDSALLRVGFGAIVAGAAVSINAQQSDDDGASDGYSDIAGTSQTVADTDDNKVFEIEIHKPGKRYLAIEILRATQNVTVDWMEAILYNPTQMPVTQTSIIGGVEKFNTPAEGTA
jgi:hypothetical protein